MIGGGYQGDIVYSDADGRYASFLLPGPAGQSVFPWLAPRPFFPVSASPYTQLQIPADVKEFTLPTIELARGDDLKGKVVDAEGRGVPGARIEATLVMQRGIPGPTVSMTADTDGAFELKSLDPSRTGLRLEASTAGARTEKPLDVSPSVRTPIVLTIRPDNLVSLAGRVVDTTGRPARGVELELWSQEAEYAVPARGAMGDDGGVLRTGADGTYRTPRAFRVDHRYRVKAGGQGVSRDWSDWTRFRPGDQSSFPDLVVGRTRPLEGRVSDSQGKPVPAVKVRFLCDDESRPETTSDEQGRFRLEVPPARGATLLFADARGFRFAGRLVEPTGGPVNLTLMRTSEPVGQSHDAAIFRAGRGGAKAPRDEASRPGNREASQRDGRCPRISYAPVLRPARPDAHARARGEGQVRRAHDARGREGHRRATDTPRGPR